MEKQKEILHQSMTAADVLVDFLQFYENEVNKSIHIISVSPDQKYFFNINDFYTVYRKNGN